MRQAPGDLNVAIDTIHDALLMLSQQDIDILVGPIGVQEAFISIYVSMYIRCYCYSYAKK